MIIKLVVYYISQKREQKAVSRWSFEGSLVKVGVCIFTTDGATSNDAQVSSLF
ncbi:MAG TPA: hypothetical protein VFC69_08890 [Dysgonamonadaceae bacterium]|nr:hypothetical protein [Dysgonamonadaceae bacterium]